MKRILWFTFVLVLFSHAVAAQGVVAQGAAATTSDARAWPMKVVFGNAQIDPRLKPDLTATGTVAALNATVELTVGSYGVVQIGLVNTAAFMQMSFEGTVDGTNWTSLYARPGAITSAANFVVITSVQLPMTTDVESYTVAAAGFSKVRVKATTYTSGSAVVTLRAGSTSIPVELQSTILTDKAGAAIGATNGLYVQPSSGATFAVSGSVTATGPLTDTQLRATPVPVSGSVTATGPLTDTQLRATPVPVSGTVTATGPLTDTQLRAVAVPVSGPLTDTQLRATPVPVSGTVTASGPLTDTQLRATPVPVSGTVTATGPLTDTQLRATAVPVSGPLTDTQLRATAVPVSGPLTDTQLRATPVPVSGTVTATGPLTDTQLRASAVPISAASLPLPTGASQDRTTAAAPTSARLSDGAAFYNALKSSDTLTAVTSITNAVATTVADGTNVTLGAKADAKSTATDTTAVSAMAVLKEISAMEQAPASRAVTNAGTFAVQLASSTVVSVSVNESVATLFAGVWEIRRNWLVGSNTFVPSRVSSVVTTAGSRTFVGVGLILGTFNENTNVFTDSSSVSSPNHYARLFALLNGAPRGALANTITVTYVADDGTGGHSATCAIPATALSLGTAVECTLGSIGGGQPARDAGIRDITAIADTAAATGTFQFYGMNTLHDAFGVANAYEVSSYDGGAVGASNNIFIMFNQIATTAQQRGATVEGSIR